jgi:dihydrodipicolinate synthase/N-acetylneuraminate lyase
MNRDRGLIAAALTPRGKRGELNFGACFELIDHLCSARVQGIALLTAAGEYPAFTMEERTRLVYLGVKRSRAPLLAGVGAEDLATAVELAREALTAGACGVVLPPPLLFDYPVEEQREYYLQFVGQVGRGAEVWIDGASGADELLATGQFAGVTGQGLTLSAEACAIPELLVAHDCARRTGDVAKQEQLASLVGQFRDWADRFAPLVAVKVATGLRGIAIGALPLPVAPERLGLLDEFREWFRGWVPAAKKMAAHA